MQIWPSGTLYINVLCMFAHLTCSLLQPYINCLRLGLIFFSSTLPRGKIVELACSKWKCIYEMDKATHTHTQKELFSQCLYTSLSWNAIDSLYQTSCTLTLSVPRSVHHPTKDKGIQEWEIKTKFIVTLQQLVCTSAQYLVHSHSTSPTG